ncbi:MAG: DUF3108 domain-containing protein [Alphaproteobacteria bacterium]|nr:DUF3108 domain-containing protein [Alphaproteobacteria bacterium]MBV9151363.1 DUF3108 domain-containing protein [Alphaproteobacteria bacterium]
MPVLSRFLALALPAIFPLVASPLLASPALAADRITMRIEVTGLAGMPVATDRTVIDESGGTYAISGDLHTTGLAGMFQNFQSKSSVHGRLQGSSGAQPDSYVADVRRDKDERHDKVDFRTGAVATGSSAPPAKDGAAGPTRDTVDPLTAYFLVERRLGQGGNCTMKIAVFDGRHRYNLTFTDAGEQKLPASNGQHYSGDTHACKMVRENVPGYPTDKVEMPQRGAVWYARLASGDLLLPVKLEMVTDVGTVTGQLAEMQGRGADLKFGDLNAKR